jgi:uncharacterized protein YjbI with pentapeptide repeats
MSKSADKSPEIDTLDTSCLDVKVEIYKGKEPGEPANLLEDLRAYAVSEEKNSMTFNEYIQQKHFPDSKAIVIADLSGLEIKDLNLKGVDLTGSLLKDTKFIQCDLQDAVFCEVNLDNTQFTDSKLGKVDFRGSDLSSCSFNSSQTLDLTEEYIEGIKLSTTRQLLFRYADITVALFDDKSKEEQKIAFEKIINDEKARLAQERKESSNPEERSKIDFKLKELSKIAFHPDVGIRKYEEEPFRTQNKTKEIISFLDQKYEKIKDCESALKTEEKKLTLWQRSWVSLSLKSGNVDYDAASVKLQQAKDATFVPKNERIMHKSVKSLMSKAQYDPTYIRGSSKSERNQKTEYVKLKREDIEQYLKLLKTKPTLTLNGFAQLKSSNRSDPTIIRFVADCSTNSNNLDNSLDRIDLSRLDFTGANISGVNFAGANLTKAIFKNTIMNGATFESAKLNESVFEGVTARDANFFNSDMSKSKISKSEIKKSDFTRAFMPYSKGPGSVSDSIFDYSNIKKGDWDEKNVSRATFDFANLEGNSMASAHIKQVKMRYAILSDAILKNAKITESDLTGSLMNGVDATKAKFEQVIFNKIKASRIKLEDTELDRFCKMQGADLRGALCKRMKADGVYFQGAIMTEIDAEFASFEGADMGKASAKFANFSSAVMKNIQAEEVDMTGAMLEKANLEDASLKSAMLAYLGAEKANLKKVCLAQADLQNATLKEAILEQVDARNAQMQGANLERTQVEGAVVDQAASNSATNLNGVDGNFAGDPKVIHNGQTTPIKEVQRQSKETSKAEQAGSLAPALATFGSAVHKGAQVVEAVGEIAKKPVSSRWATIGGALVCGLIAVAAVASAVVTGGLSLAVAGAIVVGAAAVGGVVGRVASKSRFFNVGAAAVAGGAMGGAPGALVAGLGLEVAARTAPIASKAMEVVAKTLPTQEGVNLLAEARRERQAAEANLEKIKAQVIEDGIKAKTELKKLTTQQVAAISNYIKEQAAQERKINGQTALTPQQVQEVLQDQDVAKAVGDIGNQLQAKLAQRSVSALYKPPKQQDRGKEVMRY